jgi:hypothetical protein
LPVLRNTTMLKRDFAWMLGHHVSGGIAGAWRSCNQLLALALDSHSKLPVVFHSSTHEYRRKLSTFAFIALKRLHTLLAVAHLLAEQEMFFLTGFSDFFLIFSLVNDCCAFVRRISTVINFILFTAHQTNREYVKTRKLHHFYAN